MLTSRLFQSGVILICLALSFVTVDAQKKKSSKTKAAGTPVLWERVNVRQQDLYLGPGGKQMLPDLNGIKFVREEKGGYSQKFRIKDGSGDTWVAKVGKEAQSETAAVRLLAALGYKTEINYLVPRLTIPGRGTFTNVRLEARPDEIDRGENWRWGRTPFEGTRPMQGLKLMMAFLNNWDLKTANNVILRHDGRDEYVISDLGVTFGKTGNNGLPIFWRIGRSRNNPEHYSVAKYVKGVNKQRVKVVYNGKNRNQMDDLTREDARWLVDLLSQLNDRQIRDAFRAANYTPREIDLLTRGVKSRINQLHRAASEDRLAIAR